MEFRSCRKPTAFDLVLLDDTSEQVAQLIDAGDQRVHLRADASRYQVEDDILLQFRGKKYPTRVAWAKGNELSLRFDQTLPEEIQALITRNRKTLSTPPRLMLR